MPSGKYSTYWSIWHFAIYGHLAIYGHFGIFLTIFVIFSLIISYPHHIEAEWLHSSCISGPCDSFPVKWQLTIYGHLTITVDLSLICRFKSSELNIFHTLSPYISKNLNCMGDSVPHAQIFVSVIEIWPR